MNQKVTTMDGNTASQAIAGEVGAYEFSPEVVVISDPRGGRAEAVRTLRTHVMAQHVDDGRRGLAVCAASSGVGATFTAVNLAVALAQIGVKVLLIDGDLRGGKIDQFIRPAQPPVGLWQCLDVGDGDISPFVHSDVIENLSVIFSGGVAPNAQELLARERFADVIERCLRDYDLTIIDTPAANVCADGRRISNLVGYSLIVAKRHYSFINDLKALAAQLREDRAEVVGAVMNEA